MEPDYLGSLQLGAAGNRLRRVLAVMKKEFKVQRLDIPACIAAAGGVALHRLQRVDKAAIDAIDGVERILRLRQVRCRQYASTASPCKFDNDSGALISVSMLFNNESRMLCACSSSDFVRNIVYPVMSAIKRNPCCVVAAIPFAERNAIFPR